MPSTSQAKARGREIPVDYWRTLLERAAVEVFSMMAGAAVIPGDRGVTCLPADVTAMVGLAGELCGIFIVRCGAHCATKIASKMLGVALADAGPHQTDALGEICNMVAGSFKAKIDGMEDKCMLSVPTVITGRDYVLHALSAGQRIEMGFHFEGEPIWMAVDIRR